MMKISHFAWMTLGVVVGCSATPDAELEDESASAVTTTAVTIFEHARKPPSAPDVFYSANAAEGAPAYASRKAFLLSSVDPGGGVPVFRCRTLDRHFLATRRDCEKAAGAVLEGQIGWGLAVGTSPAVARAACSKYFGRARATPVYRFFDETEDTHRYQLGDAPPVIFRSGENGATPDTVIAEGTPFLTCV